jgi:hypothetical protein
VNQVSGFDLVSGLTVARHLGADIAKNFGAGRATRVGSFGVVFRAFRKRLEGADISLNIAA